MLHQLTTWQLADKLARREVSARQVTQACLDQIGRVDGRLHAFLSCDAGDALAQADAADKRLAAGANDRPLLGVPIAIKDVIAVRGQPLRCGSKILGHTARPLWRSCRQPGPWFLGV
jgi:aspartyl-tRNA(Asn)/glutamyl-tRNA(Gln) amidotransferase subunit A